MSPQSVKVPAVGMIVTACIGIALYLVRMVFFMGVGSAGTLFGLCEPRGAEFLPFVLFGGFGLGITVVNLGIAVVILLGATRMMSLRSYPLAVVAAILCMVPTISPCCCLGLIFGIWSLVVLLDRTVRESFR